MTSASSEVRIGISGWRRAGLARALFERPSTCAQRHSTRNAVRRRASRRRRREAASRSRAMPPMASYLLALVAGELERVEDERRRHRAARRYHRRKARAGRRIALGASKQRRRYFNDYSACRIRCPSSTRSTFAGATSVGMENWGSDRQHRARRWTSPRRRARRARRASASTASSHESAPVVRRFMVRPEGNRARIRVQPLAGSALASTHMLALTSATGADERRWNVPVQLGNVGAGAGEYLRLREASPPSSARRLRRAAGRRRRQRRLLPGSPCRAAVRRAGGALARLPDGAPEAACRHLGARPRDQAPLARWLALAERIDDEPRLAVWDQLLGDLERYDRLASARRRARPCIVSRSACSRLASRSWAGTSAPTSPTRRASCAPGWRRRWRATATRRRLAKGSAASRAGSPSRRAWRPRSSRVVGIAGRHADAADYDTLLAWHGAHDSEELFRA